MGGISGIRNIFMGKHQLKTNIFNQKYVLDNTLRRPEEDHSRAKSIAGYFINSIIKVIFISYV